MDSLSTDAARYEAVRCRDPRAEGRFFYAVNTTGVYCRPGCPARLPRRQNVAFYDSAQMAERAGFRPCKRCRPRLAPESVRRRQLVAAVCRRIEASDRKIPLADLARGAGLSAHYLHRLFKTLVGVTPLQYDKACRLRGVEKGLQRSASVTQAIYEAGYASSSRFYEGESGALGMKPTDARLGGAGVTMSVAVRKCSLGRVLVAATAQGVCAISLGRDGTALRRELSARFPKAKLKAGNRSFETIVESVVLLVEGQPPKSPLPLDLLGTVFQRRVWRALQGIPKGTTVTYAELARRLGAPGAARAVGSACSKNPLAVVVPCHRVVRGDGSLGGYRWGMSRKRALLSREQKG